MVVVVVVLIEELEENSRYRTLCRLHLHACMHPGEAQGHKYARWPHLCFQSCQGDKSCQMIWFPDFDCCFSICIIHGGITSTEEEEINYKKRFNKYNLSCAYSISSLIKWSHSFKCFWLSSWFSIVFYFDYMKIPCSAELVCFSCTPVYKIKDIQTLNY